jgi:hypothetical protein
MESLMKHGYIFNQCIYFMEMSTTSILVINLQYLSPSTSINLISMSYCLSLVRKFFNGHSLDCR